MFESEEDFQQKNKGEFCCAAMNIRIKEYEDCKPKGHCIHQGDVINYPGSYTMIYNRRDRIYNLLTNIKECLDSMRFCPWCGAKLPKELEYEFGKVVRQELGSGYLWDDDTDDPPTKELPPEFLTDEWWKKRGL